MCAPSGAIVVVMPLLWANCVGFCVGSFSQRRSNWCSSCLDALLAHSAIAVLVNGSFSRFCCLPLIHWEFVIGFLVAPVLDRRLGFFLFSVLVQLQRLVSACSADCALIQRRCDCLVQAVLAFVSACSADASCCVCVAQVQCQCRLVQPTAR